MPATPFDAATNVLNRADALLAVDRTHTPLAVRSDVRRASLTMGVAAIDTYLHWAIRNADLDSLPKKLQDLQVSFADLLDMGDASVEARRYGRHDRPRVRARTVLNEALLKMSFQSARGVENGLGMVGVQQCWKNLNKQIQPHETATDIKTRLNALAHRRNQIVHEGDLVRLVRPRSVRVSDIERSRVRDDLAWIRRFVAALAVVAP